MDISLVTGASSGLGKDIAKLLCIKGHIVYVTARRKEKLLALKKECSKFAGKIEIIEGDLSDFEFRKKLINKILKEKGRINYLINNAGFGQAIFFEKESADEIQKMFDVNVVAYMHLASLVFKNMKKRNQGRIINIGSVVVFTPLPYFTVYNSTKAAVYAFNRSLRYELKGTKITSSVVLPARMKTGFADSAYDCYEKYGKKECIIRFNKIAGDSLIVAKNIVKKLDCGKEVILPTFRAFVLYSTRYFACCVDFVLRNFIVPKEKEHLEKIKFEKLK